MSNPSDWCACLKLFTAQEIEKRAKKNTAFYKKLHSTSTQLRQQLESPLLEESSVFDEVDDDALQHFRMVLLKIDEFARDTHAYMELRFPPAPAPSNSNPELPPLILSPLPPVEESSDSESDDSGVDCTELQEHSEQF